MARTQKVNAELSKVFYQNDIKTHAKKKEMWGGSFTPGVHTEYVPVILPEIKSPGAGFYPKCVKRDVVYPYSLYKGFDEVLVNVVDVWVKNSAMAKKYKISQCHIDFDEKGYISIFNNGNGIPVDLVSDIKGNPIYVPQLISTEFLAGSNNDESEDEITGGTNGIGLSMVNNNSKHFILETVDIDRKKYYKQECHNRLGTIDAPVVMSSRFASGPLKKGGTIIKFLPDYKIYKTDLKESYPVLNGIFKMRAIQTAAHMKMDIKYNGEMVGIKSMKDYAGLFLAPDSFVSCTLEHPKYPWEVVVGVSGGSFESMSIINGVHVKTGVHINYIRDFVINELKTKTTTLLKKYKEYKKSMLQNNLFIMISGNIPKPVGFDSQTKTNIGGSSTRFKEYKFKSSTIAKIWKMLKPILEGYISTKESKKKVPVGGIKKYKKATWAGGAKSRQCSLWLCEGDSAGSLGHCALIHRDIPMSYKDTGVFLLGGIIMNSRCKTIVKGSKLVRESKLVNNERLTSLATVLNLDYKKKYETKDEMDTLNYGSVVSIVDQDLDGVGQILGLVLSHFDLFWPSLIKRGYIKQFATPIIRAYPSSRRNMVYSFYTLPEYEKWEKKTDMTGWEIKYYKGLATHNDKEAIHMFGKFNESVYTFVHDAEASGSFRIYYGKDPALRKAELRGVDYKYIGPDLGDMKISCTGHLKKHTRSFQLENIKKKLPNVYDGINPARRKVLCGSINKFSSNNSEVKVFQLGGYIAEHMGYHHGSASLENTIVNMAQDYVGANIFPLLLPLSQFGSRFKGGKDAGASRYIKTKLNKELVLKIFRKEDTYVLDYTYDENERNEPVEYVPIMPMVLLETLSIPATGWMFDGTSRSPHAVYKNVKTMVSMLNGSNFVGQIREGKFDYGSISSMPVYFHKWNGVVTYEEGNQWSTGKYELEGNTVVIKELPSQTWNDTYVEKLKKKKEVVMVTDNSSKLDINIKVKIKPAMMTKLKRSFEDGKVDPFIKYLGLRKNIGKELNVIKDGVVHECKSYSEILKIWFLKRLETYIKRFKRMNILIELRIMFLRESIKFVNLSNKYNFTDMKEHASISLLKRDKYKMFNKNLLDNPGLTPVGKLKELILGYPVNPETIADKRTYRYLLSINSYGLMEPANNARKAKLAELIKQLEDFRKPDIIKRTWLAELEELYSVMKKGLSDPRGWLYGEKNSKFR